MVIVLAEVRILNERSQHLASSLQERMASNTTLQCSKGEKTQVRTPFLSSRMPIGSMNAWAQEYVTQHDGHGRLLLKPTGSKAMMLTFAGSAPIPRDVAQ